MLIEIKEIAYLEWIFNRLLYKFKDKEKYIIAAKKISHRINNYSPAIDDRDLDKILAKYYIDFYLQKDSNIGFTEKERENLRIITKNIVADIINKNIPKTHIITKDI